GLVVSSEQEARDAKTTGWAIQPAVAPLGVDVSSVDGVEPLSRAQLGVSGQAVVIACSYDPSGRFRMGAVFRTLALLAPRHVNVHVLVFGPGSLDDELRMHAS